MPRLALYLSGSMDSLCLRFFQENAEKPAVAVRSSIISSVIRRSVLFRKFFCAVCPRALRKFFVKSSLLYHIRRGL
jgi:hypothetical protein